MRGGGRGGGREGRGRCCRRCQGGLGGRETGCGRAEGVTQEASSQGRREGRERNRGEKSISRKTGGQLHDSQEKGEGRGDEIGEDKKSRKKKNVDVTTRDGTASIRASGLQASGCLRACASR